MCSLQGIDPDVPMLEPSDHFNGVLKGLWERSNGNATFEACKVGFRQSDRSRFTPAVRESNKLRPDGKICKLAQMNRGARHKPNVDESCRKEVTLWKFDLIALRVLL